MHDAEKLPLRVHLALSPQTESPKPEHAADVGKHRLHDAEPPTVAASPLRGVDLLFHLLRIGLRLGPPPACTKHHLPPLRPLARTQALSSLGRGDTVALGRPKFHEPKAPDLNVAAVSVKLVAGWTDAGLARRIVDKVARAIAT